MSWASIARGDGRSGQARAPAEPAAAPAEPSLPPPRSPDPNRSQDPDPGAAALQAAQLDHAYCASMHYISLFQSRPQDFFAQFASDLHFRQAVMAAGLTFDPQTDPAYPVLLNMYSRLFGTAPAFTGGKADPATAALFLDSSTNPPAQQSRQYGLQYESHQQPLQEPQQSLHAQLEQLSLSQNRREPSPQDELTVPSFSAGDGTISADTQGTRSFPLAHTPGRSPHSLQPNATLIPAVRELFASAASRTPVRGQLVVPTEEMGAREGFTVHGEGAISAGIPRDVAESALIAEDVHGTAHKVGRPAAKGRDSTPRKRKENRRGRVDSSRRGVGNNSTRPARPTRVTRRTDDPLPTQPSVLVTEPHVRELLNREALVLVSQIKPPDDEWKRRQRLLNHMNKVVHNEWPGASVHVFGSGGNGLGLRSGDVDMCLLVPKSAAKILPRGKGETESDTQIMRRMADLLRRNKMEGLQELLRARVPILKMRDPMSGFRIDMCVNNELVQHNTEILRLYSSLDERLRPLCLLVKYWAKRRGVNEPYRGTLSSYAYVLLVVHFLQTRREPVLPCLQRMVNGEYVANDSELPIHIIGNESFGKYNVYFDKDPHFQSANRSSLGCLLTEFFWYYAFEFDYESDLVSVRSGRRMKRSERGWDVGSVQRDIDDAEREFMETVAVRETVEASTNRDEVEAAEGLDLNDFPALGEEGKTDAEKDKSRRKKQDNKAGAALTHSNAQPGRTGAARPRKPRFVEKHLFCIEDPFNLDHDLSRVLDAETLLVIRQELVRGYEMLSTRGDVYSVCAKWEE